MKKLELSEIEAYVENHIATFHNKRISSLDKLTLKTVLKKKNPYLFRAKNIVLGADLVKSITDAFISSNEETIFGDWLEGLAIFICSKAYTGVKSSAKGIDLEFEKDNIRYIVSIKSGTNWGNSSQIAKMITDFKSTIRTLKTSNSKINVIAVNGCCYGQDNNPVKSDYFKYCGQKFWEFISGDKELYIKIIEPLGHNAKLRNEEFEIIYASTLNKFTKEFLEFFCDEKGNIDWEKLLTFNSSVK